MTVLVPRQLSAAVGWEPSNALREWMQSVTNALNSGGIGAVTSVGLTMPTGYAVTGSPVTGAGTLAVSGGPNASFVTLGTSLDLANERVLTAGTNITLTDGGAGSTLTISASGGGGSGTVTSVALTMPAGFSVSGSPITTSGTLAITGGPNASFLTLGTSSDLANERVATASSNVTIVDAGAGSTVTFDLSTTGVTPGTYGDSVNVPFITIDKYGRATAAKNVAIVGRIVTSQNGVSVDPTAIALNFKSPLTATTLGAGVTDVGVNVNALPYWNVATNIPLAASFTPFGSGQTVADKVGRMSVTLTDIPGALRGQYQSSIATPYTIDFMASYVAAPATAPGTPSGFGIALSDGTKYRTFYVFMIGTATVAQTYMYYRVDSWTNATTFSSTLVSGPTIAPNLYALRITNDGTNIKYLVSANQKEFIEVYTELTNTFLTPTRFAMVGYNDATLTIPAKASILDFTVTASVLGDAA